MHSCSFLTAVTLGTAASAYQLPQNLKSIYDNHKAGSCSNRLSDRFPEGARYCGDISGAIYLKGSNGNYDNMDIDCDGANNHAGACSNDPSGQGETAFKDTVKNYGIPDLDANVHPYVVFGNDGASPSFDPQQHGIKPLSVMAVVCNGEVVSIPQSIIDFLLTLNSTTASGETLTVAPLSTGEASISLAELCFPNQGLNGDNGHGEKDVLYIGFKGDEAVPGKNGADWKAASRADFSKSIRALGDKLVAKLQG
ncbi:probable chitosanase precursor [Fusarium fujikuroi IMI 58289]|uniref:Endo-chitosanase n=1 Tax=Gibberella fujikuroi (strain CBS 195.34 / IMI 58289 / NRRL A-6831) TaxID=1279085 RepID=S0EDF9_GIBF5|nr:probable chitosanase precursor [Fusarium fujikuroi IMI 58289]KLP14390.1 putative chitosanase precursor [Fusarium fujikuroi]CCT70428.1 probable chitosanase precursor [Fusarium fujikuroi IMI 58289]